jgi:hypothetical protein
VARNAVIEHVLSAGLRPALNADGFRRSGRAFHRTTAECLHVVDVQASRYNDRDSGRFTLNLGVWYGPLHELMDWRPRTRLPRAHDCAVNERLSMLIHARDVWWEFDENTDREALARRVVRAWQRHGAPFLSALSSGKAVRDYILANDVAFRRFHVLLLERKTASARKIFETDIATSANARYVAPRAVAAARKVGLRLSWTEEAPR